MTRLDRGHPVSYQIGDLGKSWPSQSAQESLLEVVLNTEVFNSQISSRSCLFFFPTAPPVRWLKGVSTYCATYTTGLELGI